MDPQAIATQFLNAYYKTFGENRSQMINYYNPESELSWEKVEYKGAAAINEKHLLICAKEITYHHVEHVCQVLPGDMILLHVNADYDGILHSEGCMLEDNRAEFLRALAEMKELRAYCEAKKHFTHVDAVRINRHFAKHLYRAAQLAPQFGHKLDTTDCTLIPMSQFEQPTPSCEKCRKWTCLCKSQSITTDNKDNSDYLKKGISSYIVKGSNSQELDWIASLPSIRADTTSSAYNPVSQEVDATSLTQSEILPSHSRVFRLKLLENEAVGLKMVDRSVIQPKIIQGWSDLMARVEHLYFMLGGDERVLSKSANQINLLTFLEMTGDDWVAPVDKFLASDYLSDMDSEVGSREKKSTQKKTLTKLRNAAFLMLSEADSTTRAPANTTAPTSNASAAPSYSELEDALNIRDSAKLASDTREVPPDGDADLDLILEKKGLRAVSLVSHKYLLIQSESLVDEEEAQDSQAVEAVSRDILTNQGVMQSDVPESPEDDSILTALLSAANGEGKQSNS